MDVEELEYYENLKHLASIHCDRFNSKDLFNFLIEKGLVLKREKKKEKIHHPSTITDFIT